MARPVGARVEDDLDLDGRVAPGVEDLTADDVLDAAHRWCCSCCECWSRYLRWSAGRGSSRRFMAFAASRWARNAVADAARPPAAARSRGRSPAEADLVDHVEQPPAAGSVSAPASPTRSRQSTPCDVGLASAPWARTAAPAGRPGCRPSRWPRPFSAFLICSQLAHHLVGVVGGDVAEHVRVAADELVVDAPGHVGQRERGPPRRPAWRGRRPGTAGRPAPPRGASKPSPASTSRSSMASSTS